MKRFHIAISTHHLQKSIADYSTRLGCLPELVVEKQYALWRTPTLNLSVRVDKTCAPGQLRHLGWQDESAQQFTESCDVNGIIWESFNAQQQAQEIKQLWPEVDFDPEL